MSPPQPVPTEIPASLLPLLGALSSLFYTLQTLFHKVPGSPIIVRYIKSSYQNDPWRSLLEVLLVAFALRTLLKGRTRGDEEGKNFIKLTEKVRVQFAVGAVEARARVATLCSSSCFFLFQEIDELVDDFQPQPLIDEPAEIDSFTLESVPVIHGPNGARVKLAPTGKTVRLVFMYLQRRDSCLIPCDRS